MIFETLAAMADKNNNERFDNDASYLQCVTTQQDLESVGKLNNQDEVLSSTLSNGTTKLRVALNTYAFAHHINAIQHKTPRSVIEADIAQYEGTIII